MVRHPPGTPEILAKLYVSCNKSDFAIASRY